MDLVTDRACTFHLKPVFVRYKTVFLAFQKRRYSVFQLQSSELKLMLLLLYQMADSLLSLTTA
jgi:hypothetical protein